MTFDVTAFSRYRYRKLGKSYVGEFRDIRKVVTVSILAYGLYLQRFTLIGLQIDGVTHYTLAYLDDKEATIAQISLQEVYDFFILTNLPLTKKILALPTLL